MTTPPLRRWYSPQESHWSQLHFSAHLRTLFPSLHQDPDARTTIADLQTATRIAEQADLHNAIQNHRVGDGGLTGVFLTYHWRELQGVNDSRDQHMSKVATESSRVWPFPRPGDPT